MIAHPGRKLAAFVVSKLFRKILNFTVSALRWAAKVMMQYLVLGEHVLKSARLRYSDA